MNKILEPAEIQTFFQGLRDERERIQIEINEVAMLVRQSAAEVERLAQRNAQVTTRVRQMEAAIETYPRDAIRQLYLASQESEMRLVSMRGQVEQLQAKQQKMQQYLGLLERTLQIEDSARFQDELPRRAVSDTLAISRIIEAQEEERQRLARQMHDGPTQSVTNFLLQTEICERLFQTNPEQARLELANLRNAAGSTFQKIREFIAELRPMMLDDLGLIAAARRYLQEIEEKSGMAIAFSPAGTGRRLASHVEITLFRAIQQLVTRARDEARASRVQVSLDMEGDAANLVVEDDGTALAFQDAVSSQKKQVEALEVLRQRVEMLGGKMETSSTGENGTVVRLQIPVEPS